MKYKVVPSCQIPNLPDILLTYLGYKTDGVFVEVGAFDCYTWSNTYELAMIGWKGLLFEPQTDEYNECLSRFSKNKNVEVAKMALSNWHGQTDLYLGGSLSTIDQKQRSIYLETDWAQSTGLRRNLSIKTQVSTLASELEARSWPASYDLLVVDVEGSELKVLEGSNQLACRPKLAIVETHAELDSEPLRAKAAGIDTFFFGLGYDKVQEDTINTIYFDKGNSS